jgi:predicted MFS family arabinose efflux permease
MSEEQKDKKDPFDGEYVGNIWGWRISLIGAAIIVLLSAFAAYRHYSMGVPFGMEDPNKEQEQRVEDTIKNVERPQ